MGEYWVVGRFIGCLSSYTARPECLFEYPAAFYPAPGFRDSGYYGGSGTLYHVGGRGYSWSSTMTDTYAYYLALRYGGISPNNDYHRAHGFQLRCLQE